MTRVVDDIVAALADVRPVVMDAAFGDTYEIKRDTRVADGRGGWTVTTATVESGNCRLISQLVQAPERLSGGVVTVGVVSYQAQLPPTTVLTDTDTLLVNGRTFRVIAVRRAGVLDLFPIADLQAWDEDA